MFETVDESENFTSGGSPKAGTWASMNAIQKTGIIAWVPFTFLSWVFMGRIGEVLGMIGWTSIVMGYVVGNFWRYRHALHFWWSASAAGVFHGILLSIYARLTHLVQFAPGRSGREYLQLTFLVMIAETLTLQILLKRVAMFIHRRSHPLWQERSQTGGR